MTPPLTPPTVTYWAYSIFASRTFWINAGFFGVAALSLTQVVTLVPTAWMPAYNALIAVINIALRFDSVRPVALIGLGQTRPVEVPLINTIVRAPKG